MALQRNHFSTAGILKQFKCPACDMYCAPPIYHCAIGHIYCKHCISGEECAVCQNPKSYMRSCALETIFDVLEVPCRYRKNGCPEIEKGINIQFHESYCDYKIIICPFNKHYSCSWRDQQRSLGDHCSREHSSRYFRVEQPVGFCYDIDVVYKSFAENKEDRIEYILIEANKEIFDLTWDFDSSSREVECYMKLLTTPLSQMRYYFKVILGDYTIFSGIDLPTKTEFSETRKFSELKRYCKENGDLSYRLTIKISADMGDYESSSACDSEIY